MSTIRNRFNMQPPKNLLFPSARRLIFDGITLSNGATVTVVLVAYTSQDGDIVVDFLGCAHGGASSVGWEQARSVYSMLDRVLNVADATATCRGSVGLPLEPLASSRGQAAVRRGMFLACIPCDRAYCGKAGTGADAHLSEMLGCQGILGTHRRVGMADLFHCYDGCAKATWNTTRKSCHASSQGQADSTSDSDSDDASLDSDSSSAGDLGVCGFLSWMALCRRLRHHEAMTTTTWSRRTTTMASRAVRKSV